MLKYPKKLYIIMPIIEDYVHTFLNLFFFLLFKQNKKIQKKNDSFLLLLYKNLQQKQLFLRISRYLREKYCLKMASAVMF